MDEEQKIETDNNELPTTNVEGSTGSGNMIAIAVLAIVVLVTLGWYVAGQNAPIQPDEQSVAETTNQPITVDEPTTALNTQGTSDDITSIEADLNATDLDSLNDMSGI